MMRAPALMIVALFAAGVTGTSARATPEYSVTLGSGTGNTVYSLAPLSRDSTFVLTPSNGEASAVAHGFAARGHVGAATTVDAIWWNVLSGTFSANTSATSSAGDFVITGPAGPTFVTGSLHLRLVAALSIAGGFPGNGGHAARVAVAATARGVYWPNPMYAQTSGDYRYTNSGPYASGCLTGAAGAGVDMPITLTGNFPVNVPFSVSLRVEAGGTLYGNANTNPGYTMCDAGGMPNGAGLGLESVDSQIMALPVGYTVNSIEWGIQGNNWTVAAVDAATGGVSPPRFRLAGPNPSGDATYLSLYIQRASDVSVTIFDVSGRRVRTLANDWQGEGHRDFVWDGRADDGSEVPAGLYFARALCNSGYAMAKIVRIR